MLLAANAEAKQHVAELYSRVAPVYAERGPPYFAHAGRRLVDVHRALARRKQLCRGHERELDRLTGNGVCVQDAT